MALATLPTLRQSKPGEQRNLQIAPPSRLRGGGALDLQLGGTKMQLDCSMPHRRGFTLIEIMIVVVILGILAAIVVPQFTDAASAARATSMRTQLVSMRGQIEVWRVRHGQAVPGGSGGLVGDVWDSLVSSGQIIVPPSTSEGFVWVWNPALIDLALDYDAGINPIIPDADGDGDGDAEDIETIQSW